MSKGLKTRKRQRLVLVSLVLTAVVTGGLLLVLTLGGDSFSLYVQPSDIAPRYADGRLQDGTTVRLGGLVAADSVHRGADGVTIHFTVTDCVADVAVTYRNILPDLFKEGQGVITDGTIMRAADGEGFVFAASNVLAKHDESYAPPDTMPDNPDACTHPGSEDNKKTAEVRP